MGEAAVEGRLKTPVSNVWANRREMCGRDGRGSSGYARGRIAAAVTNCSEWVRYKLGMMSYYHKFVKMKQRLMEK